MRDQGYAATSRAAVLRSPASTALLRPWAGLADRVVDGAAGLARQCVRTASRRPASPVAGGPATKHRPDTAGPDMSLRATLGIRQEYRVAA